MKTEKSPAKTAKSSAKMPKLYIVVPCYNEEAVLPKTSRVLAEKLHDLERRKMIAPGSRILFCDDGSRDKTWQIIADLHAKNAQFSGLKLSRNRGHQNVLVAGLLTAKNAGADVTISLDADLQDDPDAIDEMLTKYLDGADVVYGVRSSRETDSFFKRTTALAFYKIMKWLGADSVYNHADYRLTSRRVLGAFADFHEVNLFLRGLFPLIGFRSATVEYKRAKRFAGESKYPLKKMVSFAIDGITSFSVKPLRIIAAVGFTISLLAVLFAIWLVVAKIAGQTGQGLTFIAVSVWLIGGIQMLSIGVVGEYVGKSYSEAKARPRYVIEEVLDDDEK